MLKNDLRNYVGNIKCINITTIIEKKLICKLIQDKSFQFFNNFYLVIFILIKNENKKNE